MEALALEHATRSVATSHHHSKGNQQQNSHHYVVLSNAVRGYHCNRRLKVSTDFKQINFSFKVKLMDISYLMTSYAIHIYIYIFFFKRSLRVAVPSAKGRCQVFSWLHLCRILITGRFDQTFPLIFQLIKGGCQSHLHSLRKALMGLGAEANANRGNALDYHVCNIKYLVWGPTKSVTLNSNDFAHLLFKMCGNRRLHRWTTCWLPSVESCLVVI